MAYADDLLELARDIAKLNPPKAAHQASLRRAVSTAYYALFHLLVSEATANWARPELRATLARCFDHGAIKTASANAAARLEKVLKGVSPEDATKNAAFLLHYVATTFVQAKERREDADYNMAREWTPLEVELQIVSVTAAFEAWRVIRDEADAQAYLVAMLAKDRRSPQAAQATLIPPGMGF
jgi:uncharacterized protein (UPF0332 family)